MIKEKDSYIFSVTKFPVLIVYRIAFLKHKSGALETNWTIPCSDLSAGKLQIKHGWRNVIDGKIGDGAGGREVLRRCWRGNHLEQPGVESLGHAPRRDASGPIFRRTNAPRMVMGTREMLQINISWNNIYEVGAKYLIFFQNMVFSRMFCRKLEKKHPVYIDGGCHLCDLWRPSSATRARSPARNNTVTATCKGVVAVLYFLKVL